MSEGIKNITVLMATYNDLKYLIHSIKSILNQTHKDFEFLIIDDDSTDNTEEVVHSFKDSRISYKKISHTCLTGALNYGLKNSYGDWIARIDTDDLNTSNRLQTQINFIKKNPEYDVVSSWSVYFEDPDKILFLLKTPSEDNEIKKFLDLHNPINQSSVIFNKRKILDEGGYNELFKSYEDFELWFRIKDKIRFKIIPEYLVYTRLRSDSRTKKGSKYDIYKLLFNNAKLKYRNASNEKEKKYLYNILFWIEYFYGDKGKTRNYFSMYIPTKKLFAYLNTFLPHKTFENILDIRLRYRVQSFFSNKKPFKEELSKLLKN